MMQMPSSSMAMMKVSRNWPSGISGRMPAPGVRHRCEGCIRRCRGARCVRGIAAPACTRCTLLHRLHPCRRSPTTRVNAPREDAGNRRRQRPLPGGKVRGAQLQLRHVPAPQRVGDRAPDDLVHQRLLAKPHFGLRRVHVDVHPVRRHLDEQVHFGAALAIRGDAVGVEDRVRDGPVLDDAAIDEDVLRSARRAGLGERRNEAVDAQAAALACRPRSDRDDRRRSDTAAPATRSRPADTAAACGRRWSA